MHDIALAILTIGFFALAEWGHQYSGGRLNSGPVIYWIVGLGSLIFLIF